MEHVSTYSPATRADAVVLHRPLYSLRLRWLLRTLRNTGTRVVIDIDDLIFDPAAAGFSPAVVNGILPARKIRRRFGLHGKALAMVDAVTVSTEPLAERVRRLVPGVEVLVIPNSVHVSWTRASSEVSAPATRDKLITYSPGTRSHDKDFREIASAIERFLEAHPETRLQITGHLNHDLHARQGQVVHSPKVPFADYAERVRCGWVNLCPLEPSPFNTCKSAIKVIEAGYWSIPTICSPNPDCERFLEAGAIIASTAQEWFDALEVLLDDTTYSQRVDGLRERTIALADAQTQAKNLVQLVAHAD